MQMVTGLEGQGYLVYMDNFYSSPTLFTDLHDAGFGAVGTIDPKRKGYPPELVPQKQNMK